MSYFVRNSQEIHVAREQGDRLGLRTAQIAAIYSLASHLIGQPSDPAALVCMPTGTGKTTVLMSIPFLVQARRVLVLTPSRLIRTQIADDFRDVKTLRKLNMLSQEVERPQVAEVTRNLTDEQSWNAIHDADVAVAIPGAVLRGLVNEAYAPPRDLFDLILVDEGHHVPAISWTEVLNYFASAKKAFFTATPYRRDQLEIPARIVYHYSIAQAQQDNLFGELEFVAATPQENEDPDLAIAGKAYQTLHDDRNRGLDHRLVVRADTLAQADRLVPLYRQVGLHMARVDSNQRYREVLESLQRVRIGELDGLICVDMIAEGYDLPQLKVAAIHTPHKSLGVALQFIGRLARTNGPNLGRAKFVSLEHDVQLGATRLFREGAAWQTLIANLGDGRVHEEVRLRHHISTYRPLTRSHPDDISLYAISPRAKVDIFGATEFDLTHQPTDLDAEIVFRHASDQYNCAVLITQNLDKPYWTTSDRLVEVSYDVTVVYHHADTNLLFVCSSRKSKSFVQDLAWGFTNKTARRMPSAELSRVLRNISDLKLYQVGMRAIAAGSLAESYRMIAGRRANRSIDRVDGRMYHKGHVYGRGLQDGEPVTLGFSTTGTVWMPNQMKLPELITWCNSLAHKISQGTDVITNTEIDYLPAGTEITELPGDVMWIDWSSQTYVDPPIVTYQGEDGNPVRTQLLECQLSVGHANSTRQSTRVLIRSEQFNWELTFQTALYPYFQPTDPRQLDNVTVRHRSGEEELFKYLNTVTPRLFLNDLSVVEGNQLFQVPGVASSPLDPNQLTWIDWADVGVDPRKEKGIGDPKSIQQYLFEVYSADPMYHVVFDDDRSYEWADLILLSEEEDTVLVTFVHCKAPPRDRRQPVPGDRVQDLYVVCGQAVKSLQWTESTAALRDHIISRTTPTAFGKGNLDTVTQLLQRPAAYQMVIVQPGLNSQDPGRPALELLGGVDQYLRRHKCRPLQGIGSPRHRRMNAPATPADH